MPADALALKFAQTRPAEEQIRYSTYVLYPGTWTLSCFGNRCHSEPGAVGWRYLLPVSESTLVFLPLPTTMWKLEST